MARAWLTIAMRVNGIFVQDIDTKLTSDVLITALEALSAAEGNHALLKVAA